MESGRLKVLFLITELGYGGTPRSLQRLVVRLNPRRFRPVVVSLFSKRDIAEELEIRAIAVHGLGMERAPLRGVLRLWRLLRRERPQVLHAFNFHANLLGRMLGRLAGVPIVIVSERSVESAKSGFRVFLDRWTCRMADRWCVNAETIGWTLVRRERVPRERIVCIISGIDSKDFRPVLDNGHVRRNLGLGEREPVIISVGRLDRYKGQEILLEAFACLRSRGVSGRLMLVGGGPRSDELRDQAERLGIIGSVLFSGAQQAVAPFLAAADIFVLPSLEEGLPSAVLEAMAMGKPVVATAVGGTSEVVEDGVTGILVPPRDAGSLANAMAHLLGDPELRAKMGQAGRRRIEERFPIERTVRETETLYETLIGEKLVDYTRNGQ